MSPDAAVVLRDPSLRHLPAINLGAVSPAEEVPQPEPDGVFLTDAELTTIREECFTEGEQKGRQSAEDARRKEMEVASGLLRSATEAAEEAQRAARAEMATMATDLALQIAELILRRELNSAVDPGRDAITRCLAEMGVDEHAVFHLNPDDVVRLREVESLLSGSSHDIVPDDDVAPGDCRAELAGGSVDGSIMAALARVKELLT